MRVTIRLKAGKGSVIIVDVCTRRKKNEDMKKYKRLLTK
jgi:hypothetical protein